MRVLFVTPECAPFTKTGGLGDVSEALPAALRGLGADVRTLLPAYPALLDAFPGAAPIARLAEGRLLEAGHFLLLDNPALYRRDGGPYQSATGEDWPDNPARFGALAKAAAALGGAASPLAWRPQVVHCNDWPTGLAPACLRAEADPAASVMTVHNLAFQGNFDAAWHARLGLPASTWSMEGAEFHGQLSFLKAGLACADAITTVSPTYAREILTAEHGCGLDGFLRARSDILSGILNGIDTTAWDPQRDALIAQRYGPEALGDKAANKAALRRRLGLADDPALPLFGVVSRLTGQKGIDLLCAAAPALPGQLAVLGKGAAAEERALQALAAAHPGRVAFFAGFDEGLAHLVEAGADIFLMPSRYEPCGLNQMYSQRYGTPPVVRATGGLADTVADGVTGFVFEAAAAEALLGAARRAAEAWGDAARWQRIQRAAMARDFSWAGPARRYATLFSRLASRVPA